MAMHNKRLSHEEERPCILCHAPTKALVKGKVQQNVCCSACRDRLHNEFQQAVAHRRRMEGRREREE